MSVKKYIDYHSRKLINAKDQIMIELEIGEEFIEELSKASELDWEGENRIISQIKQFIEWDYFDNDELEYIRIFIAGYRYATNKG